MKGASFTVAWLCGALLAASPAPAAFDSGRYSHSSSSCNSSVDPITLVLFGYTAYESHARSVLQSRMGWSGDASTSQYANSSGFCTPMDGESYSACDTCERNHVRLNQTHEKDTKGRYETVGTPHYDDLKWCGATPKHTTTTYVYTRNLIMGQMASWYGTSYHYWGNTQVQYQCDGSGVASDGQVGWIDIG